MRKQGILIICFIFLILKISGQSISPQVIASDGGFFSNSNNSLSFTIGETVVSTLTGTYILTQGFQQPVLIINNIAEPDESGLLISTEVFPNPTATKITIRLTQPAVEDMILTLINVSGQMIKQTMLNKESETLTLSVDDLSNGIYILKIAGTQSGKAQSFRIEKTK